MCMIATTKTFGSGICVRCASIRCGCASYVPFRKHGVLGIQYSEDAESDKTNPERRLYIFGEELPPALQLESN